MLRSRSKRTIAKRSAPRIQKSWIRWKVEFGIFANPPDTDCAGRNLFQHSGVGVATVKGEYQSAALAAGILIEGLTELDHLLSGAQAEAGRTCVQTVLGQLVGCSVAIRFLRCGGVKKGNRRQTECAIDSRHGSGDLEEALGAHEVGLEARPEWIAAPADARRMEAGTA